VPFEGAFSPLHILIVALVALLVLGPDQLPKAARSFGQGIRELRRVQAHLSHELRDVVSDFDIRPTEAPALPMLPPPEAGDGEARGESARPRARNDVRLGGGR
jgi:TatA/E family protein of Tat protein translocase